MPWQSDRDKQDWLDAFNEAPQREPMRLCYDCKSEIYLGAISAYGRLYCSSCGLHRMQIGHLFDPRPLEAIRKASA